MFAVGHEHTATHTERNLAIKSGTTVYRIYVLCVYVLGELKPHKNIPSSLYSFSSTIKHI